MLQTFLNALPISQNGKVAIGVAFVCGAAYLPIYFRGKKYIAYESMSEKREIMKEMELADREAARVARKAAAPAR